MVSVMSVNVTKVSILFINGNGMDCYLQTLRRQLLVFGLPWLQFPAKDTKKMREKKNESLFFFFISEKIRAAHRKQPIDLFYSGIKCFKTVGLWL